MESALMPAVGDSKFMVNLGWDDAPHLDERTKAELLASTPPYLRGARSEGTPSLGAGAIYPIPLEQVTVQPFAIPPFWPRGYGMDVGWNRTAAIWVAENPVDGVKYAYTEHYMGQALPVVQATAIKARGEWIKGAIDPAARGRGQEDGRRLFDTYQQLGLNLTLANNTVAGIEESGIYMVWHLLETGMLKFFSTLQQTPAEYRLYRRDERGKIVKTNDHLMDALRYAIATWDSIKTLRPASPDEIRHIGVADSTAGY